MNDDNGGGLVAQANQMQAIQNLPPDMMLLKMENESIMAVARTVPRDPMKIVAQLKQLIDAYPAAADEAIYSKPVGTVNRVTCGGCKVKFEVSRLEGEMECPSCGHTKHDLQTSTKVKKFAEGLSIRAAESIRSIYGYTRLATTTTIQADGSAKLTGVLVDYAAGNVTSDERIISPHYKARGGRMERTPEDRFLGVVVKAEKAKLRRDVILDNTPNIIKAMFKDECEKKLATLVSAELIEQMILPAFAKYGVSLDHLEKIIGSPYRLGWTEENRLHLRKILTALKNEETNAADLIADLDGAEAGPAPEKGKVKRSKLNDANGSKPGEAEAPTGTEATPDREPGPRR